jgi:DNA-binding PadR family transcriptional regulator
MASSRTGKTVGVPRGLLRFLVLKMLSEKPMSGVEIAEQIEIQTAGRWKPSPGSLYPLLAWMLEKGFTKEAPKGPEGLKRYTFTVEGSTFLTKQIELGQDFLSKMEFLLPMLIGDLQLSSNKEKLRGTIEPTRQLMCKFITIRDNLDVVSQEDIDEIAQAIKDCTQTLEKITQRIKTAGH